MRHVEMALPSDRPQKSRYIVWSVVLDNVIAFFPREADVYFAELRGTARWGGTVLRFSDNSQLFVMHEYGEIKAAATSAKHAPRMSKIDERISELVRERGEPTAETVAAGTPEA